MTTGGILAYLYLFVSFDFAIALTMLVINADKGKLGESKPVYMIRQMLDNLGVEGNPYMMVFLLTFILWPFFFIGVGPGGKGPRGKY